MDGQLRRYYVSAAAVFVAALLVSLSWRSVAVSAGVAAGVAVSVVPFASWHAILAMFASGRRRAFLVGLVFVKYAALAGILGALFLNHLVDPVALAAGVVAGSLSIVGAVRS